MAQNESQSQVDGSWSWPSFPNPLAGEEISPSARAVAQSCPPTACLEEFGAWLDLEGEPRSQRCHTAYAVVVALLVLTVGDGPLSSKKVTERGGGALESACNWIISAWNSEDTDRRDQLHRFATASPGRFGALKGLFAQLQAKNVFIDDVARDSLLDLSRELNSAAAELFRQNDWSSASASSADSGTRSISGSGETAAARQTRARTSTSWPPPNNVVPNADISAGTWAVARTCPPTEVVEIFAAVVDLDGNPRTHRRNAAYAVLISMMMLVVRDGRTSNINVSERQRGAFKSSCLRMTRLWNSGDEQLRERLHNFATANPERSDALRALLGELNDQNAFVDLVARDPLLSLSIELNSAAADLSTRFLNGYDSDHTTSVQSGLDGTSIAAQPAHINAVDDALQSLADFRPTISVLGRAFPDEDAMFEWASLVENPFNAELFAVQFTKRDNMRREAKDRLKVLWNAVVAALDEGEDEADLLRKVFAGTRMSTRTWENFLLTLLGLHRAHALFNCGRTIWASAADLAEFKARLHPDVLERVERVAPGKQHKAAINWRYVDIADRLGRHPDARLAEFGAMLKRMRLQMVLPNSVLNEFDKDLYMNEAAARCAEATRAQYSPRLQALDVRQRVASLPQIELDHIVPMAF